MCFSSASFEERGVPASSLLITVVRQKNGAGHAVLTMRTDRGDFILDNLEAKILPWDQTEYRYLKRQSDRNALNWVSIQDNRQMIVGSVEVTRFYRIPGRVPTSPSPTTGVQEPAPSPAPAPHFSGINFKPDF